MGPGGSLEWDFYKKKVSWKGYFGGEQTYCRKQHFDKMPKAVLGNFAKNIFQE
jgi:hypothetical protein